MPQRKKNRKRKKRGRQAPPVEWHPVDEQEERLLAAVLDAPDDDESRAVYADWLLDHDPDRAAYLQLTLRGKLEAAERVTLLKRLLPKLPSPWLALVERVALHGCPVPVDPSEALEFECPERWESLTQTANPHVRHCTKCSTKVYFCSTQQEVDRRAMRNQCIAFQPSLKPGRHPQRGWTVLGRPARPKPLDSPAAKPPLLDGAQLDVGQVVSVTNEALSGEVGTIVAVFHDKIRVSVRGLVHTVKPESVQRAPAAE